VTSGLTPAEFDDLFQRFADSPTSTSVFRWEGRELYAIPRDEPSLVAFRNGTPRPERSVRTSPWLARIATSTAAGKEWSRVRRPFDNEYFRWELLAYIESQAAGEEIRIVRADAAAYRLPDFWWFTGTELADQYAIAMHYADDGSPVEFEHIDHPGTLATYERIAGELLALSRPLNEYLATSSGVTGAA
jgi:hypothetical protein